MIESTLFEHDSTQNTTHHRATIHDGIGGLLPAANSSKFMPWKKSLFMHRSTVHLNLGSGINKCCTNAIKEQESLPAVLIICVGNTKMDIWRNTTHHQTRKRKDIGKGETKTGWVRSMAFYFLSLSLSLSHSLKPTQHSRKKTTPSTQLHLHW